jgi:hypothetical protein
MMSPTQLRLVTTAAAVGVTAVALAFTSDVGTVEVLIAHVVTASTFVDTDKLSVVTAEVSVVTAKATFVTDKTCCQLLC